MRISDWSSDVCSSDLSVTLSLKPLRRSGFRARPDPSPEIGRLRKIGQRLLIKHHIAEQAVLEMVFEVGRQLRIANDEVARRIEQSRPIHHAFRRVAELDRPVEDGLCRPRQPIAHPFRDVSMPPPSHRYLLA